MAWDDIGDGLYGGDEPLDAWGGAATRAAESVEAAIGRKPLLGEVLAAAEVAMARAGFELTSASLDELRAAADGPDRPSGRAPKLQTGEILAIPYEGERAAVGLVLFGDDLRKMQGTQGLGPCVGVFDVDVGPALPDLRTVPFLIPPFHPGSSMDWARLGRVVLAPDPAVLPLFASGERPGLSGRMYEEPFPEGYVRVVRDYFGAEVPATPQADERVVEPSVGGWSLDVSRIRFRRGLCRDVPWRPMRMPSADPPLAHLPPLQPFVAKKRKPKPAKPMTDPVRREMVAAFDEAVRECIAAWSDRWDRRPEPEELGHALRVVLSADPASYVCDPGRLPDRRRATRQAPTGPWTARCEGTKHGVDLCRAEGPTEWRAWVEERDGVLFVDTSGAPEREDARRFVVGQLIPAWFAWRGVARPDRVEVLLRGMDRGVPERLTA